MDASIGFSQDNAKCVCKHEGQLEMLTVANADGTITWTITLTEVLLCNTDTTAHGWKSSSNAPWPPFVSASWTFKKVCGPCTRKPCGGVKPLPVVEKSGNNEPLASCPEVIRTLLSYATNFGQFKLTSQELRIIHRKTMIYLASLGHPDPYDKKCSTFNDWCTDKKVGGSNINQF